MPPRLERRPRLLIAEDDRDLAATMRDVFAEDFTVEVAANGHEALDRAADVCPDVVVLDARMPIVDGLAACRALRLDPRTSDLPIIMVTGDAEPAAAHAAFDAGATDYLPKPFSISQLRSRALTCLMRRRMAATAP